MKELDLVESLVKIDNIDAGTQGVIVHVYEGHDACEVEFFDSNDETIAVVTCKFEQLKFISRNY